MLLTMSFNVPYTRAQIRTGLQAVTLPPGATISVQAEVQALDIASTYDSETDLIGEVFVENIPTVLDIGIFFSSLPPGIDARLREIAIGV